MSSLRWGLELRFSEFREKMDKWLQECWQRTNGVVDSSTSKQVELDRVLAEMLQDIEDRRADALQVMVAETLQDEGAEKGGDEKEEKEEKEES